MPPNLAQGRPKRPKLAKNAKKCRFDGSGGPERLEQRGTELERGRGGPSRSFWTNFEEQIAPKFGPGAQNGPNWPKMPKNGNFKVLVVQNGWNSVERRWNMLGEVQAEVSGPISRTWVPLNLTQERPKWPILAQNGQKWQFQGFGGPKRLGQPRTKVEWVEGNPSRSFWTHSTFVPRCSNRFGPPKPRNCHFWAFWANFGHFGRPWVKFGGTLLHQIGPKTSAWTSPNLLHLRSMLFQPFRTTGT